MKSRNFKAVLGLVLVGGAAQAAGPLYLQDTTPPRPYVWDTSKGSIPVWTDGGGAFTYGFDGVTPFITIERANEITQFAFQQWSDVPTATFQADVAGSIEGKTGVADVTGANAAQFYEKQNGYGFWVLYDTDGSILEEYFGVPRYAVLGIAFPEWTDDAGHITEATAVLNGWYVSETDTAGDNVAGVFTHEFGHAINLSHSQVNGPLVYQSYTFQPRYPGVPGCVAPVHNWDHWDDVGVNRADPAIIETMFPFIDSLAAVGQEQSTITHPDDIAGISNLYPTASYRATTGAITGVLRLKDGRTQFSGINVIARNVNDPLHDAVSAMTGDQTQGRVGPDGRFTINNLTPGQDYVVYIEEITAGGYPTTPNGLVSQGEYWDVAEGSDPAADRPCNKTPIRAQAGVTKTANITFNGYQQGVQFTPIVSAYLTDLAKNGRSAAGVAGPTVFTWNQSQGFNVLPPEIVANNSSMTRNGQWITANVDFDGNGISQAALRSSNGAVVSMGDIKNRDTCGGSSEWGASSSYGWAVDDTGSKAVGTAYIDRNRDGSCESPYLNEIVPFIWDAKRGMRELDTSSLPVDQLPWIRAHAISGNGDVVLGTSNFQYAFAWVKEGKAINLTERFGAEPGAYAVSFNGRRVALSLFDTETYQSKGVALWDYAGGLKPIGSLKWCRDVPYVSWFGGDLCESMSSEEIEAQVGKPPLEIFDMSDDGSILVGRSGSFFTGFVGALWIERIGWMTWDDFFRKQGVVEANIPFSNPISISGTGTEVVGGMVGASFSWLVNMSQVFVCERGNSIQTGFPNGLRAKIAAGAKFGRCEHLND